MFWLYGGGDVGGLVGPACELICGCCTTGASDTTIVLDRS